MISDADEHILMCLFNFLNLFLAVAIFLVGSYKNMLSEVSDIIYKHKEQTGQSLDYDETFKQVLGIKE